ncbi:hypothetical protein [Flavobacterium sp. UBA7663]|uniref:hypothetical protein n=1 Tax=Flavobacterium sp. UBA7663 TaxID=1946557 RepID=UPI0025BCE4AC|nr:hypothetical protein [Flavobacterium sp. UBA7663]
MSNKILFVFEGENAEAQIVSSLQKFFLQENTTIKSVYGAEIYQIYKEIKADEDLDTFNLIKDRNYDKKDTLATYKRDDFAEIYMFFDYDGHSSMADDGRLEELLDFFNEETDKGKLYISYPMVESLKHVCDHETFHDSTVQCKINIKYKGLVAKDALKHLINFNGYDLKIWQQLITTHLKKMRFIIVGVYSFPTQLYSQSIVFSNQLSKYIKPTSTVAVLSAFPVFLHDYYGNEELIKRLH